MEVLPAVVAHDTWCVCRSPDGRLKIFGVVELITHVKATFLPYSVMVMNRQSVTRRLD